MPTPVSQPPTRGGRAPVETEIAGLRVNASPLPFEHAQSLLPDVAKFLSRAASVLGAGFAAGVKLEDDVSALLKHVDAELVSDLVETLNRHSAKLLAATTVVMTDHRGELCNYDLGKKDDRAAVFNEHPEAYIPLCLFAGRVTFARFFPAIARPAPASPAPES